MYTQRINIDPVKRQESQRIAQKKDKVVGSLAKFLKEILGNKLVDAMEGLRL